MRFSPTEDELPTIGSTIFRKCLVKRGVIARESEQRGTLVAWHNRERAEPIIEYPNGTREALRREEWS